MRDRISRRWPLSWLLSMMVMAGATAAHAELNCRPGEALAFPGPKLEAWYSQVKSQLPRSAACEDKTVESCSVRGRHGYVYWFSARGYWPPKAGRPDRWLYKIVIEPADRATPPFGLTWGDDVAAAKRKLQAAGYPFDIYLSNHDKGRLTEFGSIGCFTREGEAEPFGLVFEFRDGKLAHIDQGVPYP